MSEALEWDGGAARKPSQVTQQRTTHLKHISFKVVALCEWDTRVAIPPTSYRGLLGASCPSVPGSVPESVPENRGVRRSVPRGVPGPRVSKKCPESVSAQETPVAGRRSRNLRAMMRQLLLLLHTDDDHHHDHHHNYDAKYDDDDDDENEEEYDVVDDDDDDDVKCYVPHQRTCRGES